MSGSANPRSDNPKGELIERARALNLGEPVFESVAQGPGHEPWFTTVVSLQGRDLGRGEGRSKRDAERIASHAALQRLMAEPGPVAAEPSPRVQAWPIYAEVLSQALLVALRALAETPGLVETGAVTSALAKLEQLDRQAAESTEAVRVVPADPA